MFINSIFSEILKNFKEKIKTTRKDTTLNDLSKRLRLLSKDCIKIELAMLGTNRIKIMI
jgi:phage gp16-like protein